MPILIFLFALVGAGAALIARSRASRPEQLAEDLGAAGDEFARIGRTVRAESTPPADPPFDALPAPAALATTFALPEASSLSDAIGVTVRKLYPLPAAGAPFREMITRAEQQYGIPETLLARVLYQESKFRPDIITGATASPAGALGIAQFMPGTARDLKIDPLIPSQAIPGAARYLRQLYDMTGDWARALAAYNWGIGNVSLKGIASAPIETQKYMREILADVDVA